MKYELTLSDGTILFCSQEHPWLIRTKKGGNQRWETTEDITKAVWAGRRRSLPKYLKTWGDPNTRDSGYIAGLLDGEGYLSATNRNRSLTGGISQNPGAVLDHIEFSVRAQGFDYRIRPTGMRQTRTLGVLGGWSEQARLLGTFRPQRLIRKFQTLLRDGVLSRQFPARHGHVDVVQARKVAVGSCIAIETDTRTFFCEGFASHNSVAQHSVLVSETVPAPHAMWGLLHDAAEAYIGDMVHPLKRDMPQYQAVEERLERVIAERFGLLWPMPPEVKDADLRLLMTERRDLLSVRWEWGCKAELLEQRIVPWTSSEAKGNFLAMAFSLGVAW